MAILEYVPVNNTWCLFIFIKAFIKSYSYSLLLKISFIQKLFLFALSSKYFFLYCTFAWFNFVMFFSLVFLYTRLWVLIYLQFTFFIWLTVVQINLVKLCTASASDSFLPPKNNKKADRLCMKFSSNTHANVRKCLNPLFKNQYSLFLLLLFFKDFLTPQDQ